LVVGLAVVAALGALAIASVLHRGFSTHDEPTKIEAMTARAVRRWAVPADLRSAKNPVPSTPAVLAEARAHWADHCASCHGNDGRGKTTIGRHLYPRAPDMTREETQGLSDGELFAAIENGIPLSGMPGWGEGTAASGYASWTLVHLIRRLPQIAPEELDAMEKLNPKTPEEWEEQRQEEEFLSGGATEAPETPEAPSPTSSHEHH
jgi:mono/diheme cytochrome c family protein